MKRGRWGCECWGGKKIEEEEIVGGETRTGVKEIHCGKWKS